MLATEVLVVGAGPAGATAALNLAPTRDVILIESQPLIGPRIGESVPPVINRLLSDMGLLESFRKQGHAPCYGNRSTWGSDVAAELDFLRDPNGHGWHIDRRRFEDWLRNEAIERGTIFLAPAQLRSIVWDRKHWRVEIENVGRADTILADFVIDAGGRSAPLASRLGARRRVLDRLVCGWVHGNVASAGPCAGLTYIEAENEGWWYTASLPDSKRVLAFHTDADLPEARVAKNRIALLARATACRELSAILSDSSFLADEQSGFTAAHTAVLIPCAGPRWMAIGDAALSFDPLSAQGLLNAMFTALAAAEASDRMLSTCADSTHEYLQTIDGIHRAYCGHLKSWYQSERRWPNSVFWRRRRTRSSPAESRASKAVR